MDIDKAKEVITFARSLGLDVVGASSVMRESESEHYPLASFYHLPFVTDAAFEQAFLALIAAERITHVYTPHGVIWSHLMQCQETRPDRFQFLLWQPSPYEEDWLALAPSREWADQMLTEKFSDSLPDDVELKAPLRRGQLVGLHRRFLDIPGQSDECKLMMLAHIARLLPAGDLVEVGSFQGRSAFAIGWLASHYQIGNLVCIDPWDIRKIEHQGEKAHLANQPLRSDKEIIDLDKIFQSFIAAVALLGNVGYIRETSEAAIHVYRDAAARGNLPANELDSLPLTGEIAMLHIDGNHRYDFVRKDVDLWLPHVMNGGWVLLDDYVWAFGDGPKHVGDELLGSGHFDLAFTASDTLFLRKRKT